MQDYPHTAGMTLAEQLGQVMVVGFHGTTVSAEINTLIRNNHIGGIILFSRNIHDTQQLLELTHHLQSIACDAGHRYPLLIMIDQENGMVRRLGQGATIFPGNMALGATYSAHAVHAIAAATGRELKASGVNMNLAPVADVNNNPANPVIGIRSFGENPHHVAYCTAAAIRGYHEAGIITCLKHFPGHGDTTVDSHRFLPAIAHTTQRLEEVELIPFRSGIAAGADSVMMAHIAFPRVQFIADSHQQEQYIPASVSEVIVKTLLREQLGFSGVVISDCLEMSAIVKTSGTERSAVLALLAGIDLLLVSHTFERQIGSITAIKDAIETHELAPERIRESAERVMCLKARTLSWQTLPASTVPSWVGGITHQQLRNQVYDASVTVLRNEQALLPLNMEMKKDLLILYPTGEQVMLTEDRISSGALLVEYVRQRYPHTQSRTLSLHPTDEEQRQILQQAKHVGITIMVTMNAHLHTEQAVLMQRLLQEQRFVIGIATYNPYDLQAFPELPTYLVTYECTPPALEAAVRVLFGEVHPQGRLPVSLLAL